MKRILMAVMMMFAVVGLSACGEQVEVPPAHVGKIMTKDGMQPEIYPTSKFRLDPCWAYCDKLYVVETSDMTIRESFKVFMPKDRLNMSFDVRINGSVPSDAKLVDMVFDRVPPTADGNTNYDGIVSASQVYEIYAQPVVRSVIRDVMTQYNIAQVSDSREALNSQIQEALTKRLGSNVPFRINLAQIGDVQYPDIIIQAEEAKTEREIAIGKQEAENQIRFKKLKADLEAAKLDRLVKREQAEAVKEQNEIYAQSVTDKYLEWRKLEVLQELAKSGASVFVPIDALGTVGLSNRVLNAAK